MIRNEDFMSGRIFIGRMSNATLSANLSGTKKLTLKKSKVNQQDDEDHGMPPVSTDENNVNTSNGSGINLSAKNPKSAGALMLHLSGAGHAVSLSHMRPKPGAP